MYVLEEVQENKMEQIQTQEQTTYLGCVETAKLVRKALKENFSSQKFSVTSSQYSGGASIDVSWTNGIGTDKVNKIIKQFSGSGFDGMVDYKFSCSHWMMPDGSIQLASSEGSQCTGGYNPEYNKDKPHPDAKKVHFGADYVFAHREISDDISENCAKQLAKLNNIEFGSMTDKPEFGRLRGDNWHNIAHQFLYNRDIESADIKIIRTDADSSNNWDDLYKIASEEDQIKQDRIDVYKEKQEAKEARYLELSEKASKQSTEAYEASNALTKMMPFGQPILVGHHSEARHRREIARSHSHMDKSVELSKKSEYYADKADATKNNNAISSDNPEAIDLLKEKLIKLEDRRTAIKEFNKKARKEGNPQQPGYMLGNIGGNIATVKKRIEKLESLEKMEEIEETINGVVLRTSKEDNRVRLIFDGKPPEEVRTKLKRNEFRWSPRNGCWQRQLNPWAIRIARDLIKGGDNPYGR